MTDPVNRFKKFATDERKRVEGEVNPAPLFRALSEVSAGFDKVSKGDFQRELKSAVLAAACIAWENVCLENRLAEEAIQKAFLRDVMETFETPESRSAAEGFSEYLLCEGTEDTSLAVIGIAKRFFERMGHDAVCKPSLHPDQVHGAFRLLVEYLEGFKNDLKNRFEDFRLADFEK